MKLYRLRFLLQTFYSNEFQLEKHKVHVNHSVFRLFELFGFILLAAHWLGCIWIEISLSEKLQVWNVIFKNQANGTGEVSLFRISES